MIEGLMEIREALVACFGGYQEGEDGTVTVECCGEIRYGSGIIGTDLVECLGCGKRIINVLSPHVSPYLIDWSSHCTHFPSEEFVEEVGDRQWMMAK